jgi:hypothetical protein
MSAHEPASRQKSQAVSEEVAFLKNMAKKMRALATDHPADLSLELLRQAVKLEQQAQALEAAFEASPAKPRYRYRMPSFM